MAGKKTKEKILDAARTVFVQHGFAGGSIGNIAKLAGVNHSLIFHHFGNKQLLWVAVKQHIVASAEQAVLPDTRLALNEFLQSLFKRQLDFYQQHADITRLLAWQRLEQQASHSEGLPFSEDMQRWIAAIVEYQQRGEVTKAFSAQHICLMIVSLLSAYALELQSFFAYKQNNLDREAYVAACIDGLMTMLTVGDN